MEGKVQILITGPPGVGKTTLLENIKNFLVDQGVVVGGIFCPEIRSDGKRIGFSIIDIMDQKQGILAKKDLSGPKVGNYGVHLEDLNNIGVHALKKAIQIADYILIDEIAPMELKSPEFIAAVKKSFNSSKTVIAVVHQKSNHKLIQEIKNRDDIILFELDRDSMDIIYSKIRGLLNY
jgi:nucleoside-triphosphatase